MVDTYHGQQAIVKEFYANLGEKKDLTCYVKGEGGGGGGGGGGGVGGGGGGGGDPFWGKGHIPTLEA